MKRKSDTLVLSGPLTIKTIADTKDKVAAAIAGGAAFAVDIDSDDVDLTLPQLLLSARESAAAAGLRLVLKKPAEGGLLSVLERAGLLTGDRTADSFWL